MSDKHLDEKLRPYFLKALPLFESAQSIYMMMYEKI